MKKKQQHPGGGADPWPHGAPPGGAPPGLGSWKRRVSLLPFLRFSLRDYGFCMATLLVFCLGSLFYQLSGGPPRFLLDLRQYLGKEERRARGRRRPRKVVPGLGGWGVGTLRGLRLLPPPAAARGSPGGTSANTGAAGRGARCFLHDRLSAQRRGRPGLTGRAGTPGRGAAYLPRLRRPVGAACRRVCLWVCATGVCSGLAVRGEARRDRPHPRHGGDRSPVPSGAPPGRRGWV